MTYTLTNKLVTRVASLWTGNAWQNSTMHNQKYDGGGALIETQYDTWNSVNSSWQKLSILNYTNNANGDPLSMQFSSWNNNACVNNTLLSFTYTANNKTLNALSQQWMSSFWQNYSSTTYSYNTSGELLSTLGKKWEVQNAAFEDNNREDYTYHSSGQTDKITNLYWDKSKSSWYFLSRRTYNYDFIPTVLKEFDKEDLLVFPNPSTSQLIISSAFAAEEIVFTDTQGRTIKKVKLNNGENTVDISELPNGIYILSGAGTSYRIIKE